MRAALAPLPAGYLALAESLIELAARDDRIRALWLGGSVARGVADAGSDLDVLVAVADEHADAFAARWREWLNSFTDVLLARELPGMPGSFYATTNDCLRLDVVLESVSAVAATPFHARTPILDKDGLHERVPSPGEASGPDAEAIQGLVEEFFRQQAIFPAAVVAREDWLLGVVGVAHAQQLLYRVLTSCNAPLPPMGVKQWSAKLSPEQREVLAGLPSPQPTRASVIEAMRATRKAFREDGRVAVTRLGIDWPDDVDEAVAGYWTREGL